MSEARSSRNAPARIAADGPIIAMRAIRKIYDTGRVKVEALKGIDLEIRNGEFASIVGPSGSGKSTLMNLIGCLDTPTKGQYYINGRLVSEMNDDELARIRNKEIGCLFP